MASAGGAALAGAMATDAWQTAQAGFAQLVSRGAPEQCSAIEAQLDSHAELVAQAADPERARESLVPLWQLELQKLLRHHPEVADELRALLAQVQAELSTAQQRWVQTNIARDHATQYIVQHGELHVHHGEPSYRIDEFRPSRPTCRCRCAASPADCWPPATRWWTSPAATRS